MSLNLEFSNLKHPVYGYHLALLSTVAYYGDGKITEPEMDFLLDVTDKYLEDDVPDRELVKNEELLEILDCLRDALQEVKDVNKFEEAMDIVRLFSKSLKDLAEESIEKEELQSWYKDFIKDYTKMAKIDGKLGIKERWIISIIKDTFGLNQIGLALLGFSFLIGIVYSIYELYKWMF